VVLRVVNIPTHRSKRVGEGRSSSRVRPSERVERIARDMVIVHQPKAQYDHLFKNERVSSVVKRSSSLHRLIPSVLGTKAVESPVKKVYGDAQVRGWDPICDTFKDVPARVRPGDFETLERKILDPNT
jgi:hypothetical protein